MLILNQIPGLCSFLAATDPREVSLLDRRDEQPLPAREEIVQTFFALPLPETSALLAAVAGLSGDELLLSRVHREIAARGHALPRWLTGLRRARPHDHVVQMAHVLRFNRSTP